MSSLFRLSLENAELKEGISNCGARHFLTMIIFLQPEKIIPGRERNISLEELLGVMRAMGQNPSEDELLNL